MLDNWQIARETHYVIIKKLSFDSVQFLSEANQLARYQRFALIKRLFDWILRENFEALPPLVKCSLRWAEWAFFQVNFIPFARAKGFSCATKAGRKSDLYLRNGRGDPSLSLSWITPQLFIDTRHDSKTLIRARGMMMNRLRQNHLDPLTPRVKEPAY